MSKAFRKDDEGADDVVVPPRPPLPEGTPNYVTADGLARLREEVARLEEERRGLDASADDPDVRRAHAHLTARLSAATERLASAVVVGPPESPDEVRFGATVRVRGEAGDERRYRLVGVDEADPAAGKIAFVAPLARALLGRRAGDEVEVRTPKGSEELEILEVTYTD